jgi:hypothetical protein
MDMFSLMVGDAAELYFLAIKNSDSEGKSLSFSYFADQRETLEVTKSV